MAESFFLFLFENSLLSIFAVIDRSLALLKWSTGSWGVEMCSKMYLGVCSKINYSLKFVRKVTLIPCSKMNLARKPLLKMSFEFVRKWAWLFVRKETWLFVRKCTWPFVRKQTLTFVRFVTVPLFSFKNFKITILNVFLCIRTTNVNHY